MSLKRSLIQPLAREFPLPGCETNGHVTPVLPHGELVIERKRLRHIAYRRRVSISFGSTGCPNSHASPRWRAAVRLAFSWWWIYRSRSSKKTKNLPAWNAEIDVINGTKEPKRMVRSRASMAISAFSVDTVGSLPPDAPGVALAVTDYKRLFQRRTLRLLPQLFGAAVASTSPAFIATSQSKRSASPCRRWRPARSYCSAAGECCRQIPELGAGERVNPRCWLIKINSSGSWINAQHSPSFCFIPRRVSLPDDHETVLTRCWSAAIDSHFPLRFVVTEQASEKIAFSYTDKVW